MTVKQLMARLAREIEEDTSVADLPVWVGCESFDPAERVEVNRRTVPGGLPSCVEISCE
jgi:hypothetical protein